MNNTTITYQQLADRLGPVIMNNQIMPELQAKDYYFELFTGEDSTCYVHDTKEECEADNHDSCDYEPIDIYQNYIITEWAAKFLSRFTNEIVYHNSELDLYLWGVTHYGTSWDCVELTLINQ